MPTHHDHISLVEQAYDLVSDDPTWLFGLVERLVACAGVRSGGIITFDVRARPLFDRSSLVFVNTPDHEQEAARSARDTVEANPIAQNVLLSQTRCTTLSALEKFVPSGAAASLEPVRALWPQNDVFAIIGRNPDGTGIVGFSANLPKSLPATYVRHWTRISTHLASALRLRRALRAGGASQAMHPVNAEAIVDAGTGQVAHAEGPATPASARDALRLAVRSIDRARGKMRREDSIAAVELWRGLVAGRWSLIDRYDSDGRRYYVAHANTPQTMEPRALTLRERQVVAFAAQGHSNKLIAYELGLNISTVASLLRTAQRRLGVKNRVELVRLAAMCLADP